MTTGDIAPHWRKYVSNKGYFLECYKHATGGMSVTPMNVMKVMVFGGVWVNTPCVVLLASSVTDFRDNFGIKSSTFHDFYCTLFEIFCNLLKEAIN